MASSFIPIDSPLKKRISILAPFFHPPPGEHPGVDIREIRERKEDNPILYRGYIIVSPPKGLCFLISFHHERSESQICQKEALHFTMEEINPDGTISWNIYTHEKDPGTRLTWQTPHRLAQVIDIGKGNLTFSHRIPIKSCQIKPKSKKRIVSLMIMDGSKWIIHFPELDTLVNPNAKPPPNLLVRKAFKKKKRIGKYEVGSEEKNDEQPSPQKEAEEIAEKEIEEEIKEQEKENNVRPKSTSTWVDKIKGNKKQHKIQNYKFNIKEYQTYTMNSSNFQIDSAPGSFNGECRYRFFGAYDDPLSGIIECFNTSKFDAIEAPLSCVTPFLKNQIASGTHLDLPEKVRKALNIQRQKN